MKECEHLRGRPRDLCDGVGYSGRANPTQSASDRYRDSMGLAPIVVQNPSASTAEPRTPQVSKIGTRLSGIFKDRVDAMPCSLCREEIQRLNTLTVDQVRSERDEIIATVLLNSERSVTWYTKFRAVVEMAKNCCGPEGLIGIYLDEACDAEMINNQEKLT